MDDLLWFIAQTPGMLISWGSMTRNVCAWIGMVLVVAACVLPVFALWGVRRGSLRRGRRARRMILLLAAFPVLLTGAGAICMGTHAKRVPRLDGPAVAGAEVFEFDGPPDADLGLLVTVSGFGSESPAFCEPRELRQAKAPAGNCGPLLSRFRKRILVHLHGGMGWDYATTGAIADSLDAWLRRPENLALAAGRWNCVVAHSRGTQVVAATPLFRGPGWVRYAAHPPAGVQPYLRVLSPLCPEIAEIHAVGGLMSGRLTKDDLPPRIHAEWKTRPDSPVDFPWTVLYQAKAWDHTVQRFSEASGWPLRNVNPVGNHSSPFADGTSRFWREFAAALPDERGTPATVAGDTSIPRLPARPEP